MSVAELAESSEIDPVAELAKSFGPRTSTFRPAPERLRGFRYLATTTSHQLATSH